MISLWNKKKVKPKTDEYEVLEKNNSFIMEKAREQMRERQNLLLTLTLERAKHEIKEETQNE